MNSKQIALFKESADASYGGELRKKADGRKARPLSQKNSMHIVLRSSLAKGEWSFLHTQNKFKIEKFMRRFSLSKGVKIISFANVGNHLHLHVKLPNRSLYRAWIRGLTSGIAMMILGRSGLLKISKENRKFWDLRPFSRIIKSLQAFRNMKTYIEINHLQSIGISRDFARAIVKSAQIMFTDRRRLNSS